MMKMNKFYMVISLVLFLSVFVFSQTKSIADAGSEIKTFQNFANFSVVYEDSKDLTTVKFFLDIRETDENLQKSFKKFEWEITSIYSGNAIDEKPVRNVLCINTQSKRPNFASNNTLTILLGKEDVNFGEPNRSSEVKGGKVKENLCWDVNKEIIEDFGKAENISFQVGSIKSSIPANMLQFFRDYAKLLKLNNE
jgi:hypothetical protein